MYYFESRWPVTSDILHVLIPSMVSFNVANMDKGTEGTLRKFADDIKLGRVGDTLEGRAATHRGFNNLEERAGRRDMTFKGKRKVLHLFKSPHRVWDSLKHKKERWCAPLFQVRIQPDILT